LDGVTLCLQPMDGLDDFSQWWPGILRLNGRRLKALWHEAGFQWRYRRSLKSWEKLVSLGSVAGLTLPKYRRQDRTFISTTERLDPQYKPIFRVDRKFESWFRPTYLTDETGALVPEMQ